MIVKIGNFIATCVAVGVGLTVLVDLFAQSQASLFLVLWASIVAAFALLLGVVNLLRVHISKIKNLARGWVYSVILVIAFAVTLMLGWAGPDSVGAQTVFEYVLRPLEATFFALLALFMISAAYRAFRIKDFETLLLFIFAVIVLLGQVPIGFQIWPDFPLVKEWVLRVPAMAGIRGILLGVALGTIATGLRVLLGADRPYAETE